MISSIIHGSEEWFEKRRKSITSTDAAAILGISPWSTALKKWEEKQGFRELPEKNEAMTRGLVLEPIALKAYNDLIGSDCAPAVVLHPYCEWIMSSLDGLSSDGLTMVEIKCPGHKDHMLAKSGVIPDYYQAQCQHHLMVTDLKSMHYFSFFQEEFLEPDMVLINVERDETYQEKLMILYKKFYKNLIEFEAPEVQDGDYIKHEDAEWSNVLSHLRMAKEERVFAEEKEKIYKYKLIQLSEGRNSKGLGATVTKITKKGSVDYSKIPELKGIDLENYRTPPTYFWRVTI